MAHVGDITELNGATLPPVDIITFGSPCQDLSVAGRRAGLHGERSSLFLDAIRIIGEMREATNGKYPTWAIWENVPGALSSTRGLDFKAVLEAFAESEVPLPPSGRWANTGMVRGGNADLAWVVYNAQHFGVPQRRRRIFLVADFRGERAAEILFVPKSLRRYFAAGTTPGQVTPAHATRGADGTVEILNDQGGDSLGVEKSDCSPTLRSQTHGNLPVICTSKNCLTPWDTQQARVFTDDGTSPILAGADGGGGRNPGGLVLQGEVAPALCHAVGVHQNQCGDVNTSDTAYTLSTSSNASARNAPLVAHPMVSGTLCASGAGLSRPAGMASETDLCVVIPESEPIPINDKATRHSGGGDSRKNDGAGNGLGIGKSGDPAPTLTSGDRHMVASVDCRNFKEVGDLSGTLQAKNKPGYSLNFQNPIRTGHIVRRLTPTECERLQGYPDGWTAFGHDGKTISDTARYMMLGNSVAVPCVVYIMLGITEAYWRS